MAAITKPDLNRIWADAAPAGNVVDPGTKFSTGWIAELPPFEYHNYMHNLFSSGLMHNNQMGVPRWDAATEYQVAAITIADDGELYRSLIPTNAGNEPSTSPGAWFLLSFAPDQQANTEVIILAAGQTVCNFTTVIAANCEYYISGIDADNGLITEPEEYVITGPAQIRLDSSWPAGTKLTARELVATAAPLAGAINSETIILGDGQVVCDFVAIGAALGVFTVTGINADNGILAEPEHYTVTGANQITLTASYPSGTKIVGFAVAPLGTGIANAPGYGTVTTPSGTSPAADVASDLLNLVAGNGVTITGDSATDSITFDVDLPVITPVTALTDLDVGQPADGDVIYWNAVSQTWEPAPPPAGGGGGTGNAFTTFSATSGTNPSADSATDTINFIAGAGISIIGDATNDSLTFATVGGGAGNAFTNFAVPNGTSPAADSAADTLTLAQGPGITITGDSVTDTITISSTATAGGDSFKTLNVPTGVPAVANNADDLLTFFAGTEIGITGFAGNNIQFDWTGTHTNAFTTINCQAGTDVITTSPDDALNLVSGRNILITGNAATQTVTWDVDIPTATETNPGAVQFANAAEVAAGTADDKAVSPLNMNAWITTRVIDCGTY